MTTPNVCLVQLRDGDSLATLAAEYKLPGTVAAGAMQICEWNGVAWDRRAIDRWVMENGGRRLAYDASDPYDSTGKLGWAVFTDASRIFLPSTGPRRCVQLSETQSPTSSSGWVWFGALTALGAGIAAYKKIKG